LEDSPSEAVQRFAGLSRWARGKRSRSSPEKLREELGKAYREEVARLLVEWAGIQLFQDPSCKDLFHRSVRVGETLSQPTVSQLQADTRGLVGSPRTGRTELAKEIAALEALRDGQNVDRLQVVLLAWRLCAMDRTALHASIEYRLLREWLPSVRFLEGVRNAPTSCLTLSYAWESEGALLIAQGRLRDACLALRAASTCGEERPAPTTGWLICALHLEDRREITAAAKRLEEVVPEASEILQVAGCYRALRSRGLLDASFDPETARWAGRMSELARRTIDAIV
jgi:hypothetical protein